MRALAYFGQKDIRFTDELPEPVISADDDLLIDIAWCGICGTDLHEYTDGPIFFPEDGHTHNISGNGLPQAMGHEMAGVVSKIGPGVQGFEVGDHVVVEPTSTCLDRYRFPNSKHSGEEPCAACKRGLYNICSHLGLCGVGVQSGGFSERVVMNQKHVIKIPKHIPLDVAALVQPLAVSWHAIRISGLTAGKSALVVGGGPIGLGTILALQAYGASKIVVSEPAKNRRELAKLMGAEVFDPTEWEEHEAVEYLRKVAPGGDGFDYSFDCSGLPVTFRASVHALTFRGTAVNVSIWGHKPIDYFPMDVTYQEKVITGSMCYTMDDFKSVLKAIVDDVIEIERAKHMITGKVRIEDGFEHAIMKLLTHKEQTIKILLTPNNNGELDGQ